MNRRSLRLTRLAGLVLILAPLAVAFAGPLKATLSRPANPHGKFRGECVDCHSATAWKPTKIGPKFDHAKFGFALEGAHAAAECKTCHASLDFTQEKQLCVSCHEDVHHGEFGTECARCHTSRSFVDRAAMVRRHQVSRFPLTGSHAALDCESCHRPTAAGHMQFVGKQADCSGCHMADFQAAKSPDHAGGQFPLDCLTCHTTGSWAGARFNHDLSRFPLTGAHRAVACTSCHGDGVFAGKSTACASCHQGDYDRTTTPVHTASGFSTQCATCHNTTQWAGAVFNHDQTAFPLTGAHRAAACTSCHGDGVYAGKSTACVSCHQSDYNGTASPPHAASGFPTTCTTCHTTIQWAGAVFNHDQTAFPLTGAHRAVDCASCHGDGVYAGKSTACVSCHQADYNRTSDPPHAASGFSTTCTTCHTTTQWAGAVFNHDQTAFPLTGTHRTTACASCHGDGVYAGKSTACVSCHQGDFNSTSDPPHAASGFPTTCATCHGTTTWQGATFVNHDAQFFPIYSGAHNGRWANCATCHTNANDFAQFTCLSCHPHSDQAVTNGHHNGVSGYSYTSQRCYSCHPRGRA